MQCLLENLPNSHSRKLNMRMGQIYRQHVEQKTTSRQTHNKHTVTEFTHFCLMIQNTEQSSVYHFV